MGSLKSPCGTSYRSSVETIALCENIAFLCTHFGDRQTCRQTNRRTEPMRKGAIAVVAAP